MRGEVAAAYEMLNAALADKDKLGERLKRVEAELAAERAQRQAAQEEAARLRQELEQARQEHKVRVAQVQGCVQAEELQRLPLPSLCWRELVHALLASMAGIPTSPSAHPHHAAARRTVSHTP